MVIPAYPAFNIYTAVASKMTALGPVCVATAVNDVEGWDVEVIDENNYRRGAARRRRPAGPRSPAALAAGRRRGPLRRPDEHHPAALRHRLLLQGLGVPTVAGGQHFAGENVVEALRNGVDFVVGGEGEKIIEDLLACSTGPPAGRTSRASPT